MNNKILPKIDDKIHLTNYGYSISKSDRVRHRALNNACRDNGILTILKRLNLIRNYQSDSITRAIFGEDVDYLKNKYKKSKDMSRILDRDLSNSKEDESNNDDVSIDIEIEDEIGKGEINEENKFDNEIYNEFEIYEQHTINDTILTFRTFKKQDLENIKKHSKIEFDNSYIDNIDLNTSIILGVEKDNNLNGYSIITNNNGTRQIIKFDVIKSYRSIFYSFIEKCVEKNGTLRIFVECNLFKNESEIYLNFWYTMGFLSYKVEKDKFTVWLEKFL